MTIQAKIGIVLLCLLAGFGGGWLVHGWKDKAALTDEMNAQIALANSNADQRVKDEKVAKEDAEAKLAGEQAQTKRLNEWLNESRATNLVLQGKIDHASFTPAPRPIPRLPDGQLATSCPGSAVSAPEFMQLYNAAAKGTAPSRTGSAGHSGGMP